MPLTQEQKAKLFDDLIDTFEQMYWEHIKDSDELSYMEERLLGISIGLKGGLLERMNANGFDDDWFGVNLSETSLIAFKEVMDISTESPIKE